MRWRLLVEAGFSPSSRGSGVLGKFGCYFPGEIYFAERVVGHQVYDGGGKLTSAEAQSRRRMLHLIRGVFLCREPSTKELTHKASEAFKPYLEAGVYLSDAYRALDTAQRAALRETVENPAVRAFNSGKEMWVEADSDLLGRLERGEDVGPAHKDADC